MLILKTIRSCQNWSKKQSSSIGFVPTMGALHLGHLSLVKKSKSLCAKTIVSIYINPSQFSPEEDLETYPKTLSADLAHLKQLNVDAVFLPTTTEMYPSNELEFNYTNNLFNRLEGKSRPHFFYGVTCVVSKLFTIINPTHAFFGEKDAQQSIIIKKMIYDLKINIHFISCPIIRNKEGLALSSRNTYLTSNQQVKANLLYKSLMIMHKAILKGEKKSLVLKNLFKKSINKDSDFKIDYISIACNDSLKELKVIKSNTLISAAVYFHTIRLIDNFTYQPST